MGTNTNSVNKCWFKAGICTILLYIHDIHVLTLGVLRDTGLGHYFRCTILTSFLRVHTYNLWLTPIHMRRQTWRSRWGLPQCIPQLCFLPPPPGIPGWVWQLLPWWTTYLSHSAKEELSDQAVLSLSTTTASGKIISQRIVTHYTFRQWVYNRHQILINA